MSEGLELMVTASVDGSNNNRAKCWVILEVYYRGTMCTYQERQRDGDSVPPQQPAYGTVGTTAQ